MSGACCSPTPDADVRPVCPHSGGTGQPVRWSTMAALSTAPLPQRQPVALCLDPQCEVVYFGDRGLELSVDELKTVPGFKAAGEGTVCYCFGHRRSEIERQVRRSGSSPIVDSVRSQVENKNCACEVRNPSGRCCLPNLHRIVEEAQKEPTS